jgi:hypothetical protein
MRSSTSLTSSRFTPGANAFSLSFFFTLETHAGRLLGTHERRRDEQPGDGVRVDDGLRHQVGPVLLVRMGEDAAHDPLVDPGVAEPLGREERVAGSIVAGVVLVQIVEESGEAPEVLVFVEPACEGPHHAFDRDQVAVGRLLQASLTCERVRRGAIHGRMICG